MGTGRLEAFSDGVIAIIITIMVLELKAPVSHGTESLDSLRPLWPAFLSYVLSFIYVGIYWNNHHHLLHAAKHASGMTLWVNLHLLFWLSLIPFVTSWMGESRFATWPVVLYGGVLMMCALAFMLLERSLVRRHGPRSVLARALREERKEWISIIAYAAGVVVALLGLRTGGGEGVSKGEGVGETVALHWPGIAGCAIYALVAAIWFIPDRRIERAIEHDDPPP